MTKSAKKSKERPLVTQTSLTSTKTAPKPVKRKIFTDTPKMASSKGDKKPVTKEMIQSLV